MPNDSFDPQPTLLDRFAAIVGDRFALRSDSDIDPYVHEPRGLYGGHTSLVLRPGSVEEVSRIMKLASETGTAIVPQSGNTGLVGGQQPDKSGRQVVLSLERLDRIREVDVQSNTIIAEAGVILKNVQEVADAADRFFPLSLASEGTCRIGGNLSSNAGGTGVLAYGNARELCLGVEVVMPNGEIFDDLRKLKKDNTGYDLKDLFVGGEGTLGIITAAVLKLFPKPRGNEVAWVGFESPEKALQFFNLALDKAGGSLTAFELMRAMLLDFTVRHIPGSVAPLETPCPWYVLMQISSGRSAEDARGLIEEILGEGLERELVMDATLAANLAQAAALWRLRETMPEAQKPEGASIKHDISVPVASLPQFIERATKAVEDFVPGARVACFGHMGDGNLHFNISQPVGADGQAFLALYPEMNKVVHDIVREFSGSISAEHGIGTLKREELIATAPPVAIELMRRVKQVFDPLGIMNPGKVI